MAVPEIDLSGFIAAQDKVWPQVMAELKDGRKRTHWMWFVFPQIAGLGKSPTSRKYAIPSLAGATTYLAHPVLGPRLIDATRAALRHQDKQPDDIFGPVDAMKFRSSMTLFNMVPLANSEFSKALEVFFDGEDDPQTVAAIVAQK